MSAYFEANFAYRVALTCGTEVGLLLCCCCFSSAGMFHAAVAFVPSSFAMVLLTCAWTFWLAAGSAEASATRQRRSSTLYIGAIWSVAAATLVGWPFAGIVACGPLAVDALLGLGVVPFFREAATAFLVFVLPSALFDSYMYGRPVLAFLNILLYNSSADKGSGARLYGVEPWHYYLHNLALNFNAALPAAAVAPPLLLLAHAVTPSGSGSGSGNRSKAARSVSTGRLLLILSGLYLWVGFFSCIPHKEERFMFPVYPLLCFAAALAIATSSRLLCALLPSRLAGRRLRFTLAGGVVALCATISAMRAAGQVIYYGAPLRLYSELHAEMARVTALAPSSSTTTHDSSPPPLVVCTGNERYRFPSSFFLPRGSILAFVRDGFRGQLPAPYMEPPPRGSASCPLISTASTGRNPVDTFPLKAVTYSSICCRSRAATTKRSEPPSNAISSDGELRPFSTPLGLRAGLAHCMCPWSQTTATLTPSMRCCLRPEGARISRHGASQMFENHKVEKAWKESGVHEPACQGSSY